LPPFARLAYVSASHDGLYDHDALWADRGESAVLELVPDVTVQVRVVDSRGEPATGVPVSIRRYTDAAPGDPTGGGIVIGGKGGRKVTTVNIGGQGSPVHRTLTGIDTVGPDGIAEFRHVQEIIGERAAGQRYTFAIASPLTEPVEAEIGSDGWPEEPLVLQLPETGELEVLVVDSEGKPLLDDQLSIALGQLPAKRGARPAGMPDFRSSPSFDLVIWAPEGRALFRHVGLGVELQASVRREWLSSPLDAKGTGPTEAGERASLTVRCPVPDSRLRGRVLNEEGQPVASTELTFGGEFRTRDGRATSSGYVTYATDERGDFDLLIGPGTADGWDSLKFSIRQNDPETQVVKLASFEFDEPLEAGVKDLGDVMLVLPPLIVSGVVVDGEGKPVPGVSIEVEVKQLTGRAPRGSKNPPFFWMICDLHARSGSAGQFEIRGELEEDELRLAHLDFATGEQDTLIVTRGDTDVRFVVTKGE